MTQIRNSRTFLILWFEPIDFACYVECISSIHFSLFGQCFYPVSTMYHFRSNLSLINKKLIYFWPKFVITGHFLFSDLNQQCVTKFSIFISIGRILLAMKQSFQVNYIQWKKETSNFWLKFVLQDISYSLIWTNVSTENIV